MENKLRYNEINKGGAYMKRTLSLVLDDNNTIVLNLTPEMETKELDKFTTSAFENSEQVRVHYKARIDAFLTSHKAYIEKVEQASGKKFQGWITLLELRESRSGEVSLERVRVLYAKYVAVLPSIITYQAVLKEYQKQYNIRANIYGLRKLTSATSYIVDYIHSKKFSSSSVKNVILQWAKSGPEKASYYERLRLLIKSYEIVRKQLNLPTIDALYKKAKKPHLQFPQQEIEEEDNTTVIDGVKYRFDDIPGLEEDVLADSDYHPDGLGPRR